MNVAAWLPLIRRRLCPLLATAGLTAFAMISSTWLGPKLTGTSQWSLPHDLWGTLLASRRLAHLNLAGLYAPPTGLITFPGAAVLLLPVTAVIDAAGLSLQVPGPYNPQPGAWLLAGPYSIIVSGVVLFAADAAAERLGADQLRRAVLTAAQAVALWSTAGQWGHPEDAVAVGLLLYAVLALPGKGASRAGWLAGAAIAVQPLVLLALPFLVMAAPPARSRPGRRPPKTPTGRLGLLARSAVPGVVLVAAAAAANWAATVHAITSQPNWPTVDHPTPWTSLAAHLSRGAVAAGPIRALTILAATGCAILAGRRWPPALRAGGWERAVMPQLLWWCAAAMALRCATEPVMVAYYIWPALALVLIVTVPSWPRLVAASVAATALTVFAQASWRGVWSWWLPVTAGLGLTLAIAAYQPETRNIVIEADIVPADRSCTT